MKVVNIILVLLVIISIIIFSLVFFGIIKTNAGIDNLDNKANQDLNAGLNEAGENADEIAGSGTGVEGGGASGGAGGEGSGGSGGAGSGGIGVSENQQPDCNNIISHSIKKLSEINICNNYEGDICVDKTVSCPLEIGNLDYENSGNFEIEFIFSIEKEVGRTSLNYNLQPREEKLFDGEIRIFSSGADGDANQMITCSYTTLEIPMIC